MTNFQKYLDTTKEYGDIEEVRHPLVYIQGLPNVKLFEKIIFESDEVGMVTALSETGVEIVILSKISPKIGTKVTRTGQYFTLPVGPHLFGTVIDPIGNIIKGQPQPEVVELTEQREVEGKRALLPERKRVTNQLITGVSLVDMLLQLGKGQRQLIVGDRKVGKTSVILSLVKSQAKLGVVVIYALIGKERFETSKMYEFFKKEGILQRSVLVASSASDAASLIDLTPYSAMTLAEYFKDKGHDVLILLDDLTTHAKFYREMSLLGKKFPGRDSYPGDIFYKHARLLERAGNFVQQPKGETSITCIPVAETVEENLTDYITSNLIGITDGHLSFDQASFTRGRRPAIDLFLSVTRVGRQTQTQFNRELTQHLLSLLSSYERSLSFAHFGAELSEETKLLLKKGELLYSFLEQKTAEILPLPVQLVMIGLIITDAFSVDQVNILSAKESVGSAYNQSAQIKTVFDTLANQPSLDAFLVALNSQKASLIELCKPKNLQKN